jgi:hypothetical protein
MVGINHVTYDALVATPTNPKGRQMRYLKSVKMHRPSLIPWVEMLQVSDGIVDRMKCIVCAQVKGCEVTTGAKSYTLEKHDRKRQAKLDLPHVNVKKMSSIYFRNHLRATATYSQS